MVPAAAALRRPSGKRPAEHFERGVLNGVRESFFDDAAAGLLTAVVNSPSRPDGEALSIEMAWRRTTRTSN
jgi:hypothetical protein